MQSRQYGLMVSLVGCLFAITSVASADEVDEYVKVHMRRQHIPGLSLAVLRDGNVIKARGYGFASLELNVPASANTVYELASLSKSFVANAILLLVQDGKLTLSDKIGRYIDNIPSAWQPITVRNLLTHTSGIPDYTNDLRHDFPHDASPDQLVQVAMAAPLKCVPGEKWTYSNTDYVLLGMIIKKVSGKPYYRLLEERVFKPLGMTATRHDTPDELVPGRASGYLWYGAGGLHNADFLRYMETNHGDRGILSTVMDLAKWDAALSSDSLLTPTTKAAMWTPVKLSDGSTFGHGLGWFIDTINGHKQISHAGGSPGTATMLARYPDDDLTVIVLTNGGAPYIQSLAVGIAECYIPSLRPQGIVPVKTAALDSCTGYGNVWGGQVLTVTRKNNRLLLDDGNQLTSAFLPQSETRFIAEDADRGIRFTRTAQGTVTGMTLRLETYQTEVQRIGPLASSVKPQPDPDPALTRRIEAILKAFEEGGKPVEEIAGVAPTARQGFARGPSVEFAGMQSISYIAAQDVSGQGIERHGGKVNRVLYYRLHTARASRYVLVYLTSDNLVTDEDVVGD